MQLATAFITRAQTLTWDVGPGDGAVITDGGGIWDTGLAHWNNGGINIAWLDGSAAVIGGGTLGSAGTISVASTYSVNGLTVLAALGGGGYILTNGTLNFVAGSTLALSNATIYSSMTNFQWLIPGGTNVLYGSGYSAGAGGLRMAGSAGQTSTLIIAAGGCLSLNSPSKWQTIANGGGNGSLIVNGLFTTPQDINAPDVGGGIASITLSGTSASFTCGGILNLAAKGAGSMATYSQDGGTCLVNSVSGVGTAGGGALGMIIISNGLFTVTTGGLLLGNGGTGVFSQCGGIANVGSLTGGTGLALINLTGGTTLVTHISGGSGLSTGIFDRACLLAKDNDAGFISSLGSAVINNGGLTVDCTNFNLTIPQSLFAGNGGTSTGGLTKVGAGMLTLSGTNSYTGPTVVLNGVLRMAAASALGPATDIYISPDGVVDLPFSGTATVHSLSINGNLKTMGRFSSNEIAAITGPGVLVSTYPPALGTVMILK